MGKKQKATEDPRFKKIHSDPRFRTLPPQEQKIQVDDRFKRMFTEQAFQGPLPAKVDERGKQVTEQENPLKDLYEGCVDEQGNFKWEVESSEEEQLDTLENKEDLWESNEAPPETEPTKRIAVLNCDWKIIKAGDIYCLLRSFCPGSIQSVSIYPSEFGKKRMEEEAQKGPTGEFQNGEEVDEDKLRKYEMEQLKYYYGVAVFDTVESANKVYMECDGLEVERTSNLLDLRFIPDELELPYEPTEVCTEIPKNYKFNNFYTKALQHSKVELTWDENPPEKESLFQSAFAADDLDELDFSNYLATPSDSETELSLPNQTQTKKVSQFNKLKPENVDLEIKFNSAFDDIAEKLEQEEPETVWEKHLKEKSDKKKQKRKTHKETVKQKIKLHQDKKLAASYELLVDNTEPTEFKPNLDDQRFKKLYTDPKYGIDPTDNKFKRDRDGNKLMLKNQLKKRKIN